LKTPDEDTKNDELRRHTEKANLDKYELQFKQNLEENFEKEFQQMKQVEAY